MRSIESFPVTVMKRGPGRVTRQGTRDRRIVDDSKQEFETLVAPHFEALYRAAFRLTRRPHDAEDLVQDVLLRAYSELETVRHLEYVLGWLLRVQYRVFVDGEDLAEGALQTGRLETAWQRLTLDQRGLLALHAEGYGLAELENITGKSRNVLSARLHRARRRLSKLLSLNVDSAEPLNPSVTSNEM
jgi:DNA-directed RNA polymerase specialized sigma24 family protein